MKNNTVRFVLALLTLCLGASIEEMLPKFCNVGFPVLLSVLPLIALRSPVILPILFSLMAGTIEDALSALPLLTSSSFYLLVIVFIRWIRFPFLSAFFAFPLYQIWLCVWVQGVQGNLFSRLLVAFPLGALTMGFVTFVLWGVERSVGADETD